MSKTNNNDLKKRKLLQSKCSHLNKASRFSLNNDKIVNKNKKSSNKNVKTSEIWPKLPPVYSGQELLANKKIIKLKPVLNQVTSELSDNNTPIVNLTWNVVKLDETNNSEINLLESIKEYEIFSCKESIDNDQEIKEIHDWTIVIINLKLISI